jgi:uncharacterized protein (TIGR02246 family)
MERRLVSDVAQVYELWNAYAEACQAGDLERWMALWIDEGIQMAPDAPPRVGKDQIREGMRPGFEDFVVSDMVINTEEVQILGDWGYSHGTYTFDITPKGGGATGNLCAQFLDIVARQPDGSWKIAVDCHNFNTPRSRRYQNSELCQNSEFFCT